MQTQSLALSHTHTHTHTHTHSLSPPLSPLSLSLSLRVCPHLCVVPRCQFLQNVTHTHTHTLINIVQLRCVTTLQTKYLLQISELLRHFEYSSNIHCLNNTRQPKQSIYDSFKRKGNKPICIQEKSCGSISYMHFKVHVYHILKISNLFRIIESSLLYPAE